MLYHRLLCANNTINFVKFVCWAKWLCVFSLAFSVPLLSVASQYFTTVYSVLLAWAVCCIYLLVNQGVHIAKQWLEKSGSCLVCFFKQKEVKEAIFLWYHFGFGFTFHSIKMGLGEGLGEGSGAGEWQHGLCGCFDNCGLCLLTYIVPCYTFGKNAEAVGESCILYGLAFFVPLLNLFCLASVRGKIRDSKGIDGSFIGDLLVHFCCPLCALTQDAQEVGSVCAGQALSMDRE